MKSECAKGGAVTMQKSLRKSLHKLIAQRLETDLPSFQGNRLPPIRELYSQYGVSINTIQKAATLLRDKGLLLYRRGQAMRIVGRADKEESGDNSAIAAVRSFIEKRIRQGMYKVGQRLLKMQNIADECSVSRYTVCRALEALSKKGFVHRDAKKWYAGPSQPQSENSLPVARLDRGQGPAIIMILADFTAFEVFSNFIFARSPLHVLQAELNASGIEVIVALHAKGAVSAALPAGAQEIEALIKKLGGRYIGCFITGYSGQLSDIDKWLHRLRAYKKPIGVFFNSVSDNNGLLPDRKSVV
jgi:DNA-binding transcriptional regulator YhcF (GntR family)